MSIYSTLRRKFINATRHKVIGVPAAIVAKTIGREEISRKISVMCEFVPQWTPVYPPGHDDAPFFMNGVDGTEPVARSLWWGGWNGFEAPMPSMFAALSARPGIILDIGAFSGFYSLVAARIRNTAAIVAFEPFPNARQILKSNIDRNGLNTVITVAPIALSDHVGVSKLAVPTTSTGLLESASSIEPTYYDNVLATHEVETNTLDGFMQERNLDPVSLIKLDVEGHEAAVLDGASGVFRNDRPVLFMEILTTTDCLPFQIFFDKNNYANAVLYPGGLMWRRSIQSEGNNTNHLLCPSEHKEEIMRLAEQIGLENTNAD